MTETTNEKGQVFAVSSSGATKETKLARFDLIPTGPLTQLAEHYGRGARKYADRNWEAGYDWHLSYAALQRHLTAFWGGEDIDEETGSPHIIAAAWHAFALAEYMNTHPEFDNRPSTVTTRDAGEVPEPEDAPVAPADEPEPRTWAKIISVPHGVVVFDNRKLYRYRWDEGATVLDGPRVITFGLDESRPSDHYAARGAARFDADRGPFTEVLPGDPLFPAVK